MRLSESSLSAEVTAYSTAVVMKAMWESILSVPGTHKPVHSVWAENKHKVRVNDV